MHKQKAKRTQTQIPFSSHTHAHIYKLYTHKQHSTAKLQTSPFVCLPRRPQLFEQPTCSFRKLSLHELSLVRSLSLARLRLQAVSLRTDFLQSLHEFRQRRLPLNPSGRLATRACLVGNSVNSKTGRKNQHTHTHAGTTTGSRYSGRGVVTCGRWAVGGVKTLWATSAVRRRTRIIKVKRK